MRKFEKENIGDILALVPMQEGILFHYLQAPHSDRYFEQLTLHISGEIDTGHFEEAWNIVVKTNEMLRTVFRWENVEYPIQIILKEHKLQPQYFDFTTGDFSRIKMQLEQVKAKDRSEQFDLRQVPFRVTLCKLEETGYEMIISNHHILYDGWSTGIILEEFVKAYDGLTNPGKLKPGKAKFPVKTKYKEYVKWMQKKEKENKKNREQFWKTYLNGFDTPTRLSIKTKRLETGEVKNYRLKFDKDLTGKLRGFVSKNKTTLAALLYSTWGLLLQKYNNSNDVIFGTTVSGRSAKLKGIERMVGLFINTLPLRFNLPPGTGVLRAISKVDAELREREAYESTPLVDIKTLGKIDGREELFDSVVVIENYPLENILPYETGNGNLSIQSYSIFERTNYDLTLGITISAEIKIDFIYSEKYLPKDTIIRLSRHFANVIRTVTAIAGPGETLSKIAIISALEKEQILYEFNGKEPAYPIDKSLCQLFAAQVEKTPDHTAAVSVRHRPGDGQLVTGKDNTYVTYGQLNRNSRQLAHFLVEKGAGHQTLVALEVERSIEMILGILGILMAGCGYVPLDPKAPGIRNKYILEECDIGILLTTAKFQVKVKAEVEGRLIEIIDISQRLSSPPSTLTLTSACQVSFVNLAYVIFTSGSTGKPKGVPITHSNLSPLLHWGYRHLGLKSTDYSLQNLAYYFDWSVWEMFITLTSGARLVIVPEEVRLNPDLCIAAMQKYDITVLHITPTQYQTIVNQAIASGRRLETLKYLCIGAEKLTHDLVNRTYGLVKGDCRIFNMYGPTEATIMAAVLEIDPLKDEIYGQLSSIPIGIPIANSPLLVLDRDLNLCPVQVKGELYIAGDGLSRGYLNNPELTAEKFVLAHSSWLIADRKVMKRVVKFPMSYELSAISYIYKTGDVVRWLGDGSIEYMGRVDTQVKVRGFRIESGEIENRLLAHQWIIETIVIAKKNLEGETYLCAYVVLADVPETATDAWPGELRSYLSRYLPDYMVPAYFVSLERMPLTPNGKINLKALPQPQITPGISYSPPRNTIERTLVNIWSEVLHIASRKIGVHHDFFQLGGHSLTALPLLAKIHKEFDVKLPLSELFIRPTIRELSQCIRNTREVHFVSIEVSEKKEYYALSSAQKRLFFLRQMDDSNTAYNMFSAWVLAGDLNKDKLGQTFSRLIQRHESLRTSFITVEEVPVQRIQGEVAFEIEYYDMKDVEVAVHGSRLAVSVIKALIRPFDLSQAPLFRVGLLEIENEKHMLLVDIHHIIADGVSSTLLVQDFIALYASKELNKIRLGYKDYTQWQNREKESARVQKQARYWEKQLEGEIPVIDLPNDYSRPEVQRFEGSCLDFELDRQHTNTLKTLALEGGATLYMVLLAIYTIFLSKISNQEDIVVGMSLAGRRHADLEKTVGMFVNTLPLRSYPAGEKIFIEFLAEVRERVFHAFENQEYQYEDLVELVKVNRDVSRNPLFDTTFLLQDMEVSGLAIPGLKLTPYEYETITSKFDLTLESIAAKDALLFRFQYSTKLFKSATIERFVKYFKNLVLGIHEHKTKKLSEMEIISEEERHQVLYEFNDTQADYPKDKPLHQLFEEQVEKNPDPIALVGKEEAWKGRRGEGKKENAFGGMHLSYRELHEKSNQLAGLLIEKGVQTGTIVGIMLARSVEMIIGILGILKAGGAYLPIDADYPEERINYMLQDSNAGVLVTTPKLQVKVKAKVKFINLASSLKATSSTLTSISTCPVSPTNLAYIIYTSGSTGKPKGVLVQHFSVVNLVYSQVFLFGVNSKDRILQFSTICFDASVEQIFIALFRGAVLVLIDKDILLDANRFEAFITSRSITHIHAVPSFLVNMKLENASQLKRVLSGGDVCPVALAKKWSQYCDFYNRYGPTEATVTSIEMLIRDVDKTLPRLPIGSPINNTGVYLLDRWKNLVPLGVTGELHIGGDGLARGYLNQPELTNYKFLINKKLLQGSPEVSQGGFLEKSPPGRRRHPSARGPYKRIYKTGDLARWLSNGDIEFLGRIDHQVKIRGFRIELEEIECQLLTHSGIKDAVVLSRADESGDKYLCAYVVPGYGEPGQVFAGSGLREYLLEFLPDYMVPAYIIEIDEIPLTNSGKIDRGALPAPVINLGENDVAPRSETEKKLMEIWGKVLLGRDTANAAENKSKVSIGIDVNFFQLGGHSLKAITLISKVHKVFDIKLPLVEIFKRPTIRALSQYIKHGVEDRYRSIEAVEEKEYCSLSSAQRRLFFLHQMDENGTAYNISSAWVLAGDLNKDKLEQTFNWLVRRHQGLRTSFEIVNEEPVQRIHDEVNFKIEYFDVEIDQAEVKVEEEDQAAEDRLDPHLSSVIRHLSSEFIRPFDISQAPLLRVGLIKLLYTPAAPGGHPRWGTHIFQEEKEGRYLLIVDMHHMISDGTSIGILVDEFMTLYRGQELPEQRLQYTDFSEWQKRMYGQGVLKEQEQYWQQQMRGEIPRLHLPTDFLRPALQTFAGSTHRFEINSTVTHALKTLAFQEDSTLFMVILTLTNIFFAKLCGQEDILIGIPVAGRRHADLATIVGMFVNTLVLRNQPTKETTVKKLLKKVNREALNAFENQDYQYENLVEMVAVERDASRNPLFDVMLVFQGVGMPRLQIPGLQMVPYHCENKISKFDLTLYVEETPEILQCVFEYSTNLFKFSTIQRFIAYFNQIADSVVRNPGLELGEIGIITEGEKKQILLEFNQAVRLFPEDKTLMHLFREQVEQTPDRIALISRGQRIQLSYKELYEKSLQLARVLKEKGVGSNTIVGLMVDRSIEMMIGLYGILKAGGAYMPLAPDYPRERVLYMLEESGSRILITREKYLTSVTFEGEILDLQDESLYSYPSGRNSVPGWETSPEDLVYVIYTSGSTGKPRGVPIKTKGFVNLVNWYIKEFAVNARDRFLLIAPISFDLTQKNLFAPLFIGGCLCLASPGLHNYDELSDFIFLEQQTVINCAPSVFYPFVVFNGHDGFKRLQSLLYVFLGGEPIRMDQLMPWLESGNCRCNIVNTYGPTECTDVVSFYRMPLPGDKNTWPRDIPIGGPVDNVKLYVLDDRQNLLPVGLTGEVCIGGIGVSRGYLNNPELTAEKFVLAHSSWLIADRKVMKRVVKFPMSYELSVVSYIYKTGDLGRWLEDGNIEFLGRIDHQVKVRGLRIELGEIENQLLKHEVVKEIAVAAIADENRGNYLCGYIVTPSPGTLTASVVSELKEHLSKHLPGYMIPGYFVRLEELPLTPSGKVDRKALPLPRTEALREIYTAPQNPKEEKLAEIWSEILGMRKDRVSINANFFELGGNSLSAAIMVSKIHRKLNVKVPLAEIFKTPTIRKLSAYIKNQGEERYAPIEPVEEKEYYELSSVQKRLYVIYQLNENSTVYNIHTVLLLEGKVDKGKLENIFRKLIQRHESLRTSFQEVNGETVQRADDHFDFKINHFDSKIDQVEVRVEEKEGTRGLAPLTKESATGNWQLAASTIKNFIRPFDLSHAPLLRVALMRLPPTPAAPGGHPHQGTYNSQQEREDKYLLMLDMHHIVSDGISCAILVREVMALAAGEKLPGLKLQYKDYTEWQKGERQKSAFKEQESYWKKQFIRETPVLDLPTDFIRPTRQSFLGSQVTFEIEQEKVAALKSMAMAQGTTLYMVMLALYYIFLWRLSNQEDIIVGTPTTGRGHADLEPIIGMFVNTLVLRNYPGGDKSFPVFLKEIKVRSLEAFAHQDYLYEDLVDQVAVTRDTSRNPLFDTMFVIQDTTISAIEIRDLKLSPLEYQSKTSKFDLLLIGVEAGNKLSLTFEYSTRLFTTSTIQRFINYFNKIVSTVLGNPTVKLSGIEIIQEEEKRQILDEFNNKSAEFPKQKTIHELFHRQVEQTPDHIAAAGNQQIHRKQGKGAKEHTPLTVFITLTYKELNQKSNQLAHYLYSRGVKHNSFVGLMMEKSLEMIIAILGILKAGGAYLPINPKTPTERIRYMLADSGTNMLLSKESEVSRININDRIELILIDKVMEAFTTNPLQHNQPILPGQLRQRTHHNHLNLAYIIYTSGSTGKPKGVPIIHSNFSPLLYWGYMNLGLGVSHRTIQNLAFYFDWSVWEIFITLTTGACLYPVSEDVLLNPEKCIEFMNRHIITVLHVTPTQYQYLLPFINGDNRGSAARKPGSLRYLFIGAEKLTYDLACRSIASVTEHCRVFNMYGPTEATIISAVLEIHRNDYQRFRNLSSVPIGQPVANTILLILDRYLKLCPVNITGELYIGGDGLAPGYLGDPEKSADSFIRNIYQSRGIPGECLYKSGDLTRWLPDGNIEYLGRQDFQVKIRGFRIELGEIEKFLFRHPNIKEAVVLVKESNTKEKYLCAYMVLHKELSPAQVREFLSGSLPAYMIPSYFVCLDKMPLNANGKIDSKKLPEPAAAEAGGKFIAARNTIEEKLVLIWAEVLSIPGSEVSIDSDFFEIGGHSLKALRLLNAIQKEFNIKIDFQDIFQYPTIAQLSRLIQKSDPAVGQEIQPQSKQEYYDLSYPQWRLMVLYQLDADSPAFNLPTRITLYESLDETIIRKVLEKLVERHDSFRTYFKSLQGEPVQIILPRLQVNPEVRDLSHLSDTELEKNRQQEFTQVRLQPFKLDVPPLFRMELIKCREEEFDLIFIMHHIITDGWSMDVLKHEFSLLYESLKKGKEYDPEPLKIRYIDYVNWHNRLLGDKEKMRQAKEFWKNQLKGNCPVLELPDDYSKKNLETKKSAAYRTVVPAETTQALRKVAKSCKASLFMVLLAGYNIMLSRITGQQDILLAVPGAARQHDDLKNIVGMFVNTLIVRNKTEPGETFSAFLEKLQADTLKVLEHQSYPLELICSEFKIPYPEISVFFNMSTFGGTTGENLKDFASYHIEQVQQAKFDIVSYIVEYKNGIDIETHYFKELFKPMTIEKIMNMYLLALENIVKDPKKKIGAYNLMTRERKLRFSN
ncbi:MAG: amino acid adenylation domain-containing protein [Candidatus Aminicenantes bacterium]